MGHEATGQVLIFGPVKGKNTLDLEVHFSTGGVGVVGGVVVVVVAAAHVANVVNVVNVVNRPFEVI